MPFNDPIPDSQPRKKLSGGLGALVQAEKLMQIALVLPCAAVIGWLAGGWLDIHLHQKWMSIAGILFGGFSGLYYVVRLAISAANEPDGDDGNRAGKGTGSSTS